jgi:gas vesicle protein
MSNLLFGFAAGTLITAVVLIFLQPAKPKPKRSHHKRKSGSAE